MSDSPDTPSGFGNVTRFVCEGLARRGHRVSILGWQTREAYEWKGCGVHPVGRDPLGADALLRLLIRYRPEMVIALADVWWLPYFSSPEVRRQMELTDTPWALYFPIDGDMQGEQLPGSWVELLKQVDVPIAMSRYGQRIAFQAGITCEYIPHGVDLEIFCPPASREEAKARIGAAGKFVVLSDSRNQPRKMLPRLLEVFAKFAAGRPDVLLHLHTDPDDEFTRSGYYSYDVRADLRHLGIESQVRFTPGLTMKCRGGVPLNELALYYQAADVHLLASSGEGFGLPTLQAAAAGAVPMAGAYTASLELVEGHGEAIEIAEWSENEFGIRRALIDVEDAARKLAVYYGDRSRLAERSALSRRFAESYGWDTILNHWDALLRSIGIRTRRIGKTLQNKTLSTDAVAAQFGSRFEGASVRVNVIERKFGQLEAGIVADTRGRMSDVRIPAIQQPCELARLRVLRNPGYVGVAPGDQGLFNALKLIFPILEGWMPGGIATDNSLTAVLCDDYREARYRLAQSVLMFNVSGALASGTLIDAGLYGVPCIGTGTSDVQRELWPELAVEDSGEALILARELLTNAARLRRLAGDAREKCRVRYSPDEDDSAVWLRRLHARQSSLASVAAAR